MTKEQLNSAESEAIDEIDPIIYYLYQMMTAFRENYFSCNEDLFEDDSNAQRKFVASYQEMSAELYAMSELIYNVRLKIDFATGQQTNIAKAYLETAAKNKRIFEAMQEAQKQHEKQQ